MKAIRFIIISVLMLVGVGASTQAASEKEPKKKAEQVTFAVPITCDNCVQNIKKNIPYEKGVKDLKIDRENQKVSVTYNPAKTDVNKLKEAFKKIGKEAEVVEDEAENKEAKSEKQE